MSSSRLLTVGDVADQLGISRNKAYELIYRGQIESLQIGRLRRVSPAALAKSSLVRRSLAACRTNPLFARAQLVPLTDHPRQPPRDQRKGVLRSDPRSI